MSIKAMQWVFEHSRATGSARVLMLAIADRANDDGVCWPDKANLAKKVNVTERTIIKLVQQCEELGELSVSLFYRGKERRTANRYIMMALAPAEVRATATPVVTVPLPPKMAKDRKRRGLKGEHVITPVNRDAHITPPVNTSSPGGVNTSSPDSSVSSTDKPHSVQDAKAPASEPSKAKPKPARKPRPTDAYYEAIVDAFGYDRARITKTQAGNIGKVATELYHAGYDAEDVAEIYKWCKRQKWTGGFTVNALTTQAANWAAARPHRSGTPAMHVPLAEHDDMLDALLEDVG